MWPKHRARYASQHYKFLWYVEIHLYLPKKISTYDGFGFEKDTLKVGKKLKIPCILKNERSYTFIKKKTNLNSLFFIIKICSKDFNKLSLTLFLRYSIILR